MFYNKVRNNRVYGSLEFLNKYSFFRTSTDSYLFNVGKSNEVTEKLKAMRDSM
jgi:hypothetical protein